MVASALPVSAGSRRHHDCVGFLYYSAFMQQTGAAPVCLGFSQVRDDQQQAPLSATTKVEEPQAAVVHNAPPPSPAPTSHQSSQASSDFKMVCVGYSTYDSSATALPHCEGLEVVLYHSPAAAGEQQQGKPGAAQDGGAASMFAVDQDVPQPLQFVSKLASKAAQNLSLVQAALRNEGAVKLKPLPKDMQELETRVMATFERHAGRMQRGAQRVASNAYLNTVKPLAAILGLSGTTGATRSPKSP